jgi:hypothetical protein
MSENELSRTVMRVNALLDKQAISAYRQSWTSRALLYSFTFHHRLSVPMETRNGAWAIRCLAGQVELHVVRIRG